MSTFVDHNLGVREGQRDGQIVGGAAHIFHSQKKSFPLPVKAR